MLYFVLFLVLLLGTFLVTKSFSTAFPQASKLRKHLYAMGLSFVFFALALLLTLAIEFIQAG